MYKNAVFMNGVGKKVRWRVCRQLKRQQPSFLSILLLGQWRQSPAPCTASNWQLRHSMTLI